MLKVEGPLQALLSEQPSLAFAYVRVVYNRGECRVSVDFKDIHRRFLEKVHSLKDPCSLSHVHVHNSDRKKSLLYQGRLLAYLS